jgi:hypothetical protein
MAQESLFAVRREIAKGELTRLEKLVIRVFEERPDLRNIGNKDGKKCINELIRYIWANYGDENASSIVRIASKIRAERPEYDTEHNQNERANAETAAHQYFGNYGVD